MLRHESDQPVLIVAASGRALAASARRGGFAPLVADWFGDQDMLAAAAAHRHLACGVAHGMEADAVLDALETLAHGRNPLGVVCGGGFEDRPALLARIAQRWPLLGNTAETVARVKDPAALAALCAACGIPHPTIAFEPPRDPGGWLIKRRGGSGGGHITMRPAAAASSDHYYQRRVPGRAVSALILADGREAVVLGCSEQWCAPTAAKPFRYGGAVAPAALPPHIAAALANHLHRMVAEVPLLGLNSIDFMLDGDFAWLLEINPRPGATLDVFEPHAGSLFARHVAACNGALPTAPTRHTAPRAAMIVYADCATRVPVLDWPDWLADRSPPGSAISAGEPVCTVLAQAPTAMQAKQLVLRRADRVRSLLRERAA
jgi:predicted ATP-grasp superfamily ATP-dependent carboligase